MTSFTDEFYWLITN